MCVCVVGKYRDASGECVRCVDGMDCDEIGSSVTTITLTPGHWRANEATSEVIVCPVEAACPGGANTTGSCAAGNFGILCAICQGGYYRPGAYSVCKECGSQEDAVFTAIAIVVAMVIAILIFIQINRRAPNGLLRPFIDLVQKVSVMLLFDAPFPQALVEAGRVLAGMSFGLDVVSPQCTGIGSDFHAMFKYTVAALIVLCASLLVSPVVAKFKNGWSWGQMALSEAGSTSFRDLFVVVLLLHPTVSGKAMEFFRCRTIDGVAYLMADYSLECYDSTWFAYLAIVLLVLMLFSLGTPCVIAYVRYARRATLYDADGAPKPQPLDVLYAIYHPRAFYYESVQMVFKLALWSALVFFNHGSEMQLAAALIVNVLQLCVHIYVLPMGGKDATLLNTMQSCTLVLTTQVVCPASAHCTRCPLLT